MRAIQNWVDKGVRCVCDTRGFMDYVCKVTIQHDVFNSKKSTFKSPTIRNLLEISDALSTDHRNLSQKGLSLLGGRYTRTQHRKKLQVGLYISNPIHSIKVGSMSIRRVALIVEGT